MAQITKTDVYNIAPELDMQFSDATVSAVIADAYLWANVSRWPSEAKMNAAVKYLVAHLLTITLTGGGSGTSSATGAVTSRTVGAVTETYSTTATSGTSSSSTDPRATLGETGYGREYQRRVRITFGGPRVL